MIKVLDNTLINKIAAGEVVERPSSVVKELIENAIDAGASSITIEVKNGGIDYIRVSDNGKGIPAEQLRHAFLRHATSKITDFDDLLNVLTLGFRGEALSSIASVSEVEVLTKTADNELGRKINLLNGEVKLEKDESCADGTNFIVRNLFANVPARRKFLKRPATESGYVSDIITKNALGNPNIAFKYINNETTLLQTNGNGILRDVVFCIYGSDVAKNMVEVLHKQSGFKVNGLCGKNELARANRSYENFYINGRYVKSDIVHDAVMDAYQTRLPIGRFPVYVLSLSVDPKFCDVNVHPTKLEVRFSDENAVYQLVKDAVSNSLNATNMIPAVTAKINRPVTDVAFECADTKAFVFNDPLAAAFEENILSMIDIPVIPVQEKSENSATTNQKENKLQLLHKPEQTTLPQPKNAFFDNYRIIGQIFGTYWVVEQGASIYYMDQHAAHERVLFDEVSVKFTNGTVPSQSLLVPVAINMQDREKEAVFANIVLLEKLGFEIEELNDTAIAVRSVPYIFSRHTGAAFFSDILDVLISDVVGNKVNDMAAAAFKINYIACKAAVKANDRLSYTEAKALIERALKLDNPFTCPHGRPTIVELSEREIEKMFKR